MKTDDWITLLATGEGPAQRHAAEKRLGLGLLCGGLGAVLLTLAIFGPRSDLAEVARTPLFWAKLALPGSLALLAFWLIHRLARPGVEAGARWALVGLPVLAVWIGAAISLYEAPLEARTDLILGRTWQICPLNIALLSVPTFVAVFWALRGLAPIHLHQAGAAGGLLASTTATLAYCLHCPEMGVPFWGLWYVAGMLVPTLCGAVLGPALLRW